MEISMKWEIFDIKEKPDVGVIVKLLGVILDENNTTLVTADAKIILLPSL